MKENKQKSRSYVKPHVTAIKVEPTCILAGSGKANARSIKGGTWSDWEEDEVISSSEN